MTNDFQTNFRISILAATIILALLRLANYRNNRQHWPMFKWLKRDVPGHEWAWFAYLAAAADVVATFRRSWIAGLVILFVYVTTAFLAILLAFFVYDPVSILTLFIAGWAGLVADIVLLLGLCYWSIYLYWFLARKILQAILVLLYQAQKNTVLFSSISMSILILLFMVLVVIAGRDPAVDDLATQIGSSILIALGLLAFALWLWVRYWLGFSRKHRVFQFEIGGALSYISDNSAVYRVLRGQWHAD